MIHDSDTLRPTICHALHSMTIGGAEVLAREFALRASDPFRVIFACLDEIGELGAQLRDQGYVVEVMQRRPGFDARCAWRLARFFRQQRVDLVHAHQYAPFFYVSLARLMSRPVPILFTEHGRDYPDYRRPKRVMANKLLLRGCDRIVGVGECVRTALMANEGFPADRMMVTYNGVDTSRYDGGQSRRHEVRKELHLDGDDLVVMQVARLNRLKDHATAIRGLASLVRNFPTLRLLLVGDGEERANIDNLVRELDLEKHVRLLGIRLDIPRLLEAADVFLLTSITEGIPLTLIEAMLARLPCVATRVGGTPEVIVEGVTGLLAEPSEPANIATVLQELLEDPELRMRLGQAGRQRALEVFDDRQMHRAYRHYYDDMLGLMSDALSPDKT